METFAVLKEDAATASALADIPRRPHAQRRLDGPARMTDTDGGRGRWRSSSSTG